MAGPKNSAKTDIESRVTLFAQDLTFWARDWLRNKQREQADEDSQDEDQQAGPGKQNRTTQAANQKTKNKKQSGKSQAADQEPEDELEVGSISFKLATGKDNRSRTPADQARFVVAGTSKVCWSAHMGDKGRHVQMWVNNSKNDNPEEVFGDDVDEFKKKWGELMKTYKLKNASGTDGWVKDGWDPFHLEMPKSKLSRYDKRSQACLGEYVRLTRQGGEPKNDYFEKRYEQLLKPHVKKYEKPK